MVARDELLRHDDGRLVGLEPQLPHREKTKPEYPKFVETPSGGRVKVHSENEEAEAMTGPHHEDLDPDGNPASGLHPTGGVGSDSSNPT